MIELDGLIFIDGASNTHGSYESLDLKNPGQQDWTPYASTAGLIMAGLGLRGGWSEWQPSKKK